MRAIPIALTVVWTTFAAAALAQPADLRPPSHDRPASNITPATARSTIAPRLPAPPVGLGEPPRALLLAARAAVEGGRTGEAQEALERAETRLLDRSTVPSRASVPDNARVVLDIGAARRALAARDRPATLRAIDDALAALDHAPETMPVEAAAPVAAPLAVPLFPPAQAYAPPPVTTYALLPGHWTLRGATYEWTPPETMLRRVETQRAVQGRYVWRGERDLSHGLDE